MRNVSDKIHNVIHTVFGASLSVALGFSFNGSSSFNVMGSFTAIVAILCVGAIAEVIRDELKRKYIPIGYAALGLASILIYHLTSVGCSKFVTALMLGGDQFNAENTYFVALMVSWIVAVSAIGFVQGRAK